MILLDVYNVLEQKFNKDEPIFISEIEMIFQEYSRPWIDNTIKAMVEKKQLKRFSTGVYYIPRKTIFGDSLLNPQKVIDKKYIKNDIEVYGYVSGMALLNRLGITTQVPNTITIVTNNETSRGRNVKFGNQTVYVMNSKAKITKENVSTLQLLESIRLIDLKELDTIERTNLEQYIYDNKITLAMISEYCSFFPDYVSKKLLEGGLIAKFTQ